MRFQLALFWSTVTESRCGCGGSNKAVAVECDSPREEQLLQALSLIE